MRRNNPPVKRGREQFAIVLCTRFRVRHAFSGRMRDRGSLTTPPNPLLRSRRHASVSVVAARRDRASGQPSCQPSRPARCEVHRPATRIDPCPEVGGGQGIECLSNERFQLILLQACAEFLFHTCSHLLPGLSGCLHLLEHVKCLCQGTVLGIFPVLTPSPKGPCHFPAYSLRQCSLVHGFFQGHDWVFQAAGSIPVGAFATGTSGWFFRATGPPGLSAPMTDLLPQF